MKAIILACFLFIFVSCQSTQFDKAKINPYSLQMWARCKPTMARGKPHAGTGVEFYLWNRSAAILDLSLANIRLAEASDVFSSEWSPVDTTIVNFKSASGEQTFQRWSADKNNANSADSNVRLQPNDAVDVEFRTNLEPLQQPREIRMTIQDSGKTSYKVSVPCQ